MKPEEVPDDLVRAGDAAEAAFMDARWGTSPDSEERVRAILAAVLPPHKAAVLNEMGEALEAVPDYAASDYDRGRVAQRHDDAEALFTRAAAAKP